MRDIDTTVIAERYGRVAGTLNERGRRAVAATEALALGRGGLTAVAEATGLSRNAIARGVRELRGAASVAAPGRVRRPGGGRKSLETHDPSLRADLEALVGSQAQPGYPATRGDPCAPLRWTCKSLRHLAGELRQQGHRVSHQKVADVLHALHYRLQGDRKTREGASHPDRDAQFGQINATAQAYLTAGDPVISVDTKKKELVGDFKQGGREWRPRGEPEEVRVHDFVIKKLGRATPSGVSDMARNEGWVNVGLDHDTATFAVESIRRWWTKAGRARYPQTCRLLITADGGGSNGSRLRLWKWELQRLADETGLQITVCHYPPGTSNTRQRVPDKIEHRLFAFISQNWRGRPLVSYAVILSLIAATTTATGLTVESYLDTNPYPTGVTPTDAQMATLHLRRAAFHGEWNYTIAPRPIGFAPVIV